MEIHNLIEDVVIRFLDEVLEEKDDICKCHQCKLDMACFALNKIRPMYVVSSRGIIHSEAEKRESNQKDIDVMSVVIEAVNVVSKTRRHGETIKRDLPEQSNHDKNGFYFNFPHIIGRVIDTESFMPASDLEIYLHYDTGTEPVKMMNSRWKNPVSIVEQMAGTFTFWPSSIKAEKKGIQKDFQLNIELKKEGYDTIRKYFEIRLISDNSVPDFTFNNNVFHLDDIFLYKENNKTAD